MERIWGDDDPNKGSGYNPDTKLLKMKLHM